MNYNLASSFSSLKKQNNPTRLETRVADAVVYFILRVR
jgi:hypothetical protein